MSQDLLNKATKALGESGHDQQGAQFTRERLMASLHARKHRRRSRFAVLLPLAAIFVGSTAFAAVTGALDAIVVGALQAVGVTSATDWPADESVPDDQRPNPATARPIEPTVQPPVELEAEPDEAAAEAERANDSEQAAASAAPAVVPTPKTVIDDGQSVYRRAHEAHFKSGDLTTALVYYERYLTEHPSGRFAVDARYNRALCLVRLGRHAEARSILRSFADGAFGTYRQGDAARLLEAIDAADARDVSE